MKPANEVPASAAWCFDRVPLITNRLNRHWRVRHRERKSWEGWILAVAGKGPWWKLHEHLLRRLYLGEETPAVHEPKRAQVGITAYRSRLQDPDNRVASVKPLLDALQRTGWLVNDDEKFIELLVLEKKCKRGEEKTEIVWSIAQQSGKEVAK